MLSSNVTLSNMQACGSGKNVNLT